jgi:peptidoglycan/LPS O-acetylase OafA/YrhL
MQANKDSLRSTGFYAPELDALRCLAVTGVMIAHFSPTLARFVDWGALGVRLFFVLSGFLITEVLLNAGNRVAAGRASLGGALWQFFVRRVFRLWPLYYGSLLGAYALNVAGTNTAIAWHLLFATNNLVFLRHEWPALLSHYWTLAVEQQFYVIWPLAVLLLPRRVFPGVLVVTLLAGPLTRAMLLLRTRSSPDFDFVLLPCCFDFFAAGGAVAWWRQRGELGAIARRRALAAVMLSALGWIALGAALRTTGRLPNGWVVYDALFQAVGFAALIAYVLQNAQDRGIRWLRLPPLVYIGQISYGIYIFHNFMHRLGPAILRRITGENYFHSETLHVLYLMALSIAVASVSYHLLEAPVRRLGRRIA